MMFDELSYDELRELDEAVANVAKHNVFLVYWEAYLNWTEGSQIFPDNLKDQISFLKGLK